MAAEYLTAEPSAGRLRTRVGVPFWPFMYSTKHQIKLSNHRIQNYQVKMAAHRSFRTGDLAATLARFVPVKAYRSHWKKAFTSLLLCSVFAACRIILTLRSASREDDRAAAKSMWEHVSHELKTPLP